MKKVYVAGAINGSSAPQVLANIKQGIKAGATLLSLGFCPFIPHLDYSFALCAEHGEEPNLQQYRDWCLEWLKVCDVIVVLAGSGNSEGVKVEIEYAIEHKIPVMTFEQFIYLQKQETEANKLFG